jgi:two-component system, OmpR family, phosphate regulon sensor histidine kinase PhoR
MSIIATVSEEQWLERERLLRLLHDEQQFGRGLRLLLFALALLVWSLRDAALPAGVFLALWGGLLLLALRAWQVLQPVGRLTPRIVRRWLAIGMAVDVLLVVLVLLSDGAPDGDFYLLFVLLAIKSVFLYSGWKWTRALPFLFIPLYGLAVAWLADGWAVLLERFLLHRFLLLLLVALATLYLAEALHGAREQARLLNLRLGQRKADLDTRTQVLTQTATNLANRVLELRTLQEGVKAINASLDLGELLELVVENASQVFGGASCAIGLRDNSGRIRVAARSPGAVIKLEGTGVATLEALAEQVVQQRGPALVVAEGDGDDERWTAVMAVPMVVDGETIGALMAARVGHYPLTDDDQQRLNAFADQAALAVKNSRLYEQVERLYQEVKERSAELEAVLASIGDAVIVTGRKGHVRLTNPVANIILGLPDEVPPDTPLPDDVRRGGLEDHLRWTLENAGGDPVLGELTVRAGNLQRNRTYQALSAPLREPDGRPRGVVTVLRDVTAAKELEQLKSNFVSTISHELKTPLHSIKGFVNIILSEKSTGELTELQRDFLLTVRDQTAQLERMIVDLLEYSRLESGQIKLNPEPLDLSVLAETVTEQLRPVADEAVVSLLCSIDEVLPVEGDRMRLEQVFNNLIANAIKFSPSGGRVTVMGEAGPGSVEIVVRDTGIGVPLEEQERIFERFYQVDASQARRYGGTGLGLAICRHIIDRHGGRIWVESKESEGSAFHFVLPREIGSGTALTVDFSRLETG